MREPVPCLHCQRPMRHPYARGLCERCHRAPDVREQYPRKKNTRPRQGDKNEYTGASKPCQRTDARPGTAEYEAVLRERARLGQELFHPEDGPPSDPLAPSALECRSYRRTAASDRAHRAHLEI